MKLINFSKSAIDEICKKAPDVTTAFLEFYKVAVPEFDNVKQINSFPVVSDKTAIYCIDKLSELSRDALFEDFEAVRKCTKEFYSNFPSFILNLESFSTYKEKKSSQVLSKSFEL